MERRFLFILTIAPLRIPLANESSKGRGLSLPFFTAQSLTSGVLPGEDGGEDGLKAIVDLWEGREGGRGGGREGTREGWDS